MNIEKLRKLCFDDKIQITDHAFKRCRKRSISYNDIISCIMNGIIIEEYPDDYPFPSALILEIKDNNPLHVVAGMSDEYLWVITAYRPDKEKWENDYKKRKEI